MSEIGYLSAIVSIGTIMCGFFLMEIAIKVRAIAKILNEWQQRQMDPTAMNTYETLIANCLRIMKPDAPQGKSTWSWFAVNGAWIASVVLFINEMREVNPNFDRKAFNKACGRDEK